MNKNKLFVLSICVIGICINVRSIIRHINLNSGITLDIISIILWSALAISVYIGKKKTKA
ncbi:hypothetical protein DQG23_16300 [Paenibacillus contaminans]|uniref:Uncharacterized protein n=1 Tax=Paenibacillus contaminans TaxID=450362 RepID=A0A329ML55_9BACL|nr:hypothetical protein DQG23_16300 [Paenibacillus contaminans]